MTATAWDFPEDAQLDTIEQLTLPRLAANMDSPFLSEFPDEAIEDHLVLWEQEDNYTGLMQWRGYNGLPPNVRKTGQQRFAATPGIYGEMIKLNEDELTRRRRMGTFGTKVPVSDLVGKAQAYLLTRELQLKEKILSDLVINGTYSVLDGAGQTMKTDTYTRNTSASSIAWGTHATATPLADIQAACLSILGTSAVFDSSAKLVMNQVSFNNLILNRNAADIYGVRLNFGQTPVNTLGSINDILGGMNLPKIQVYDKGYLADDGTRKGSFTRYVASNRYVIFGRRTSGAKIGSFAITWNLQAGGRPAAYTQVIDRTPLGPPGGIEVHRGFSGGPTLKYPGAIIVGTGI